MSKYVLMHGTFVELSDEELMHWKYIKREKQPDGSYRYYYKDDNYDKAKQNHAAAQREKAAAIQKRDQVHAYNNKIIDAFYEYHNERYSAPDGNWRAGLDENVAKTLQKVKPYLESNNKASHDANVATVKASAARENLKAAKRVYDKSSGHKIASLLTSASKTINKAKKWFKSLFP